MCVIGIVSREKIIDNNLNVVLYFDYPSAVYKGGGIPLIIPIINEDMYISDVLTKIDGLLIPGGSDVNPKLYDQENTFSKDINDNLDDFEIKMIKAAHQKGIPIFGICRGIQVINVAFKGTLLQDITLNKNYQKNIIHEQHLHHIPKDMGVHDIHIAENSFLYELYGKKLKVNSYHHQAVDMLGEGLKAVAYSDDWIVEAFENESGTLVWGIEWHPEKTVVATGKQVELFKKFISICMERTNALSNQRNG